MTDTPSAPLPPRPGASRPPTNAPVVPLERPTRRRFLLVLVGFSIAYGLSVPLAPLVAVNGFVGWLIAYIAACSAVVLASVFAPSLEAREWFVAAGLAVFLVTVAYFRRDIPISLAGGSVNFALLALGGIIGGAVGARVDHAGYMVLLAWVAGVVDIASVFAPQGPTAQIVASPDVALPLVTLAWPVFGTPSIEPIVGVGDIAIASVFGAATRRNELSSGRLALGLCAGFVGVLVALLLWERFLPALPMLAAASVLALAPESVRIPREDRLKGIAFAALITGGAAWFLLSQ